MPMNGQGRTGGGGGGALRSGSSGGRAGSARIRDWGLPLAVSCLVVCLCLCAVLAIHLSLANRWTASWSPIVTGTGAKTSLPSNHADAAGAHDTPGNTLSRGGAANTGTGRIGSTAASTATAAATTGTVGKGSSDAVGTGDGAPAGSSTGASTPGAATGQSPRLSAHAEALSDAELHGGWQLTREAFDRATLHPNATVVSLNSPRVVLVRDFLTTAEVEHLVQQATGGFQRSEVVSDQSSRHEARTSSGSWLNGDKRDDKVREVQHRIHQLVGIPEAFGESIYVLQYEQGQKYDVHTDHCALYPGDTSSPSCRDFLARAGGPGCGPGAGGITCGDRLATVILFLRSPTKGGSTAFPRANYYTVPVFDPHLSASVQQGQPERGGSGSVRAGGSSSGGAAVVHSGRQLRQQGSGVLSTAVEVPWYCKEDAPVLQVRAPAGSALLFWDYVPAGSGWQPGDIATPDPASLHGGCPVLEGTKLIATRWIRSAEFH